MTTLQAPLAHPARRPSMRGWARRWARWWPLLGALAYAGVLALMPGDNLHDRDNYLAYLENAPIFMLGWLDGDVLQILSNEPIWILVNAALGLLLPQDLALRVLIFVPAAIVAHRVLGADPRHALLLLAFLLLPQVVKNHVVHLRQGLGVAVFLFGWFTASRRLRWGLLLLTPLLHSSFFFVLLILVMARLMQRWRMPLHGCWAAFIATGITVALSLGALARTAGARQGEEAEFAASQDISGLGFLFWSAVLIILLLQSRKFLRSHVFEIGTVLFYLATYFLSPFTARVFESTLPVVLLASLRMRGTGRTLFLVAILAFGSMQFLLQAISGFPSFVG